MKPVETLEHMEKKMVIDLLNVLEQEVSLFIKADPTVNFNVELEEYDRGNCLATGLGYSFDYKKHSDFSEFIDKWCRMASKLNMLDIDDTMKYEDGTLKIELRWNPSVAPQKVVKNKKVGFNITKKMM